MFYRFKSKLATQDRLEAFPVEMPGTKKYIHGPWIEQYEQRFSVVKENVESNYTIYRAPKFDDRSYGVSLRFNPGKVTKELPDIWSVAGYLIVSERFRQVVEAVDDFEHEYLPMTWIDHQEKEIATEYKYYWFNLRRFLKVAHNNEIVKMERFLPLPQEEDFLYRVLQDPELRRDLDRIPLWRHYCLEGPPGRHSQARMVLYFNQALLDELRTQGITGMDEYSDAFGVGEESLVGI